MAEEKKEDKKEETKSPEPAQQPQTSNGTGKGVFIGCCIGAAVFFILLVLGGCAYISIAKPGVGGPKYEMPPGMSPWGY